MSPITYSCPYFVGAELFLIASFNKSGQSPTPIGVRVIELFPFTQSQVMKVAIQNIPDGSDIPQAQIVILKLYDRRYLEERGPDSENLQAIWSPEKESHAAVLAQRDFQEVPVVNIADGLEERDDGVIMGDMDSDSGSDYEESVMSETEWAFQLATDDKPINQWLIEERYRHRTRDWFNNELRAYALLQHLEGYCVPRFFGSVAFDNKHLNQMPPGILTEITGILIEFVDGISVDKIAPNSLLTWTYPTFGSEAVKCFSQINQSGVIHGDIRLANLLLRLSDGRIFVIDFAHAKFQGPEQTNESWNKRIRCEREASAIEDFTERLFNRPS
jgi:serine/threonine protein kinase